MPQPDINARGEWFTQLTSGLRSFQRPDESHAKCPPGQTEGTPKVGDAVQPRKAVVQRGRRVQSEVAVRSLQEAIKVVHRAQLAWDGQSLSACRRRSTDGPMRERFAWGA